jgi:hypothetical protein
MGAGGPVQGGNHDGAERYASERFTRAFGRPREDGASRRWRCMLSGVGVWIELKRNPVSGVLSLRIEPERSDAHALISKIKFTELRDLEQVDLVIGELQSEGAVRERGAE